MINKKKIICLVSLILIIFSLVIIVNKNSKKYIMQDGIMLALTLDGDSRTTFPEGTNYRVEIKCENGIGKWLPEEWKFVVENITGNVKCNLDFTTRKDTDKLTNELKNNVNAPLTQSEYINITNTSTYPFTWDGTNSAWTQSAIVAKSTSVFMFYPSEPGYYELCYTLPASAYTSNSSSYKNYIGIGLNSGSYSYIYSNYNSGETITDCYDFGYLTMSDRIYIKGYYYDNNISFSLQNTNYIDEIDGGYRYVGSELQNYVWFNNEIWRIIGSIPACTALDDSKSCTKIETLTKIIRNESIGALVWNTSSSNNWPDSSLHNLLNNAYLNSDNGTESGHCYGSGTTIKSNCDYSIIGLKGINSYYGNMIKNAVWNLGGVSNSSSAENYYSDSASEIYTYENGTIVYGENETKTIGYVGLLSLSDFRYGGLWLYNSGYEWMLTPISANSTNVVAFNYGSSYSGYSVNSNAHAVRPVVYLDSNVYIVSGDGSITNPYQIGM